MRTRFFPILAASCLAFATLLVAPAAFAQSAPTTPREPIETEIPIPITTRDQVPASEDRFRTAYLTEGKIEDLAQYIGIIYNFLISIVGLVAAVVMIVGGFQYLTSAGDSSKIGAAKSRMANAFIGMVLAFGSYTILNTINPELLRLKLPDFRAVTTVVFTLPVCEDVIAQGTTVQPYGSGTECGNAGKYKQGNAEQVCIFNGSCRLVLWNPAKGELFGHKTCMQKGGMESEKVKQELAQDPNKKFTECISCADITSKKAIAMDFQGDIQVACEAWQHAFDLVPSSFKTYTRNGTEHGGTYTIENGLFYGCYPRTKKEGCVGVPLFCWDITRNDDELTEEDYEGMGCTGYDEGPHPIWASKTHANGFASELTVQSGSCTGTFEGIGLGIVDEGDLNSLECFPVHLGTVCAQNPCADFLDPETGRRPFRDGCKNNSGTVFAAQRVVRYGDIGSANDCRCQVVDIAGGGCTGE